MAFPLLLAHLFLFPILIILVQTLPIDATEARTCTAIFSTTATTNNARSIINRSPSAIVLSSIRQNTGEADK